MKEKLGEGARGEVYRVVHHNDNFAMKLFKGSATSDGQPEDEIRVMQRLGAHDNLVCFLASIVGTPDGQLAKASQVSCFYGILFLVSSPHRSP